MNKKIKNKEPETGFRLSLIFSSDCIYIHLLDYIYSSGSTSSLSPLGFLQAAVSALQLPEMEKLPLEFLNTCKKFRILTFLAKSCFI